MTAAALVLGIWPGASCYAGLGVAGVASVGDTQAPAGLHQRFAGGFSAEGERVRAGASLEILLTTAGEAMGTGVKLDLRVLELKDDDSLEVTSRVSYAGFVSRASDERTAKDLMTVHLGLGWSRRAYVERTRSFLVSFGPIAMRVGRKFEDPDWFLGAMLVIDANPSFTRLVERLGK